MGYTPEEVIKKRRYLWETYHDIDRDTEFRFSVAEYMGRTGDMDPDGDSKRFRQLIYDDPWSIIEIFFIVVNKKQETQPFFLNDVQNEFKRILNQAIADFKAGKRNHLKFLLLKGRQQGFTTVISAYQLACTITKRNFSGMTLADTGDNTEAIFSDKAKFPYETLPAMLKPSERYNTRREFHFQRPDGHGLNSRWRITTAGNKDAGRSKTLNFFHGSETAFWENLKTILTGLAEALTANCIAILESTANGFNDYKELWDEDNNWECLFFEWWKTSEYRMSFVNDLEAAQFKSNVLASSECTNVELPMWAFSRCKWLLEKKGLTWEQVYWYFDKWKDKREMIKQEYPCTPEEAFLSSGLPFFDLETVARRVSEVRDELKRFPPKRGYFEYAYKLDNYTGNKLIDDMQIKWVDSDRGYITIYEEPLPRIGYLLGGDTASDGADLSIGQVIMHNGKQMAVCCVDKDEDLYADQMYCLGRMYNWALIATEVNHSTHPTKVLVERQYRNLYIRGDSPDSITGKLTQKYGFQTNQKNRSDMLGEMRTLAREDIQKFRDLETLLEMMSFVKDEKGKPVAEAGKHDDRIMAFAIAYSIRSQSIAETKPPADQLEGFYTQEELEDLGYSKYDIRRYMEGKSLNRR